MSGQLNPKPVKSYTPPNVPTLADTRGNRDLLKAIPLRWRQSAAVVAAISFTGMWLLTGCHESIGGSRSIDNCTHRGGAGGAPTYIVYFTEDEALEIIRTQLSAAGLNLDATPPDYTVKVHNEEIGLDLYDSEKGVAIAYIGEHGYWNCDEVAVKFTARDSEIAFGVFADYGGYTGLCTACNPSDEQKAEGKERVTPHMVEKLTEQIDDFIKFLQKEGII